MTQKPSYLLMRTLFLAAMFLSAPAFALEPAAPSDAQLKRPGVAAAAPAAATPAPEKTAVGDNKAGDPCPAPEAAMRDSPDDLAKVQEEIDRFTLCVQRAQLIERLNDSTVKNQQADDLALGYQPGIAGAQQNVGMPALPANALGGADVSPLPNNQLGQSAATPQAEPAKEEPKKEEPKEWTIREIFGSGNDVQAKLLSPDGDEIKARSGTKLPDGKTTVVRITPAGVTVRASGKAKTLEWARS